ncbi:MAG TPA: methylated-DNA--[protein]-cysteine S-methyltransferase [Nocardioidaceae bacterium]|nr:methylated-DNA--[protein]-cysteine S-methyltransferase [Nocardioidaceae bacterium]
MTIWTEMDSPVGVVRVVSDDECVTSIMFDPAEPPSGERDDEHPVLAQARTQLAAYFAGDLKEFNLPLSAAGTPFQQRVWDALRAIGYGETVTYGEIARRLGLPPGASRAVGLANGRNPIAIVVPCHRVIGSNGKLVGYAGGLDRKQKLLSLESAALF